MRTQQEEHNRKTIKERKPEWFKKIEKHPEMIKQGKCVALVQLQYKYDCNFKCKHCAIARFQEKGNGVLTPKDVKIIADQCDKMGLGSICISGGEPLYWPEEELKAVVDAIGQERFCISVDTNGYFLTDEKIKWLVDIGVDRIHLSIDGLENNHSMFRGNKASWGKCIGSLENCKKHGLGVIINIVTTKSLIKSGELEKQLEFVAQFGFHTSMIFAKPVGAFEGSKDEVLGNDELKYVQSLTDKYNCSTHLSVNCGHHFGCLCFKRHFSITAHGDVLACPWIPIKFGNILKEPLQDIVYRGLEMKWFSYDYKFSCLSGNRDGYFYKNIIPQIQKASSYPAEYKEIDWGA